MTLEILEPGLSTTVQDRGRFGHYNVGIPQGGSMDQLSAEIVNALVGNTAEEAVLECTYLGPKFRTSAPAVIAVGGAPVEVKVNGATAPQWEAIELAAGDEVSFGFLQGGTRYYVAVRGGIDVPLVLGSRSTYALGALGGYQGRKLAAGDEVPVGRHGIRGGPGRDRPGAAAGIPGRNGDPGPSGPLRPPADRGRTGDPAGVDLDAHPGGRQDGPALQRAGGRMEGAGAALRCRFRSLQHRRRRICGGFHPDPRRQRTDRPAPRRRVRGRLRHGRNRHQRGHGPACPQRTRHQDAVSSR